MLSDYSIILRKCKSAPQDGGVVRLQVKEGYFLLHLGRLPHLPGVPHVYVNRFTGTVKLVINGIPNPGLAVILLPSSKTSA